MQRLEAFHEAISAQTPTAGPPTLEDWEAAVGID
jgi:hypothetical protein